MRSNAAPARGGVAAHRRVLRERPARYRAGGDPVVALSRAVDAVLGVDLDELDDTAVQAWTAGVQRQLDRLEGGKRRAAGLLQRRASARRGPGGEAAARREVDDFLREGLRLSPGDARRATSSGRTLSGDPQLAEAVDDGRLRPDHVEVIAGATRQLAPELAGQVRSTLTAAAGRQDPVELGKTARRLVARLAPDTAEAEQRRAFARRTARTALQPDGTLLVHARVVAGVDAETAQRWIDKYRVPDADGEHRSPEQRTYDALLTGMRAGLDDPCGPKVQGVSPHVTVLVRLEDLLAGVGTGEAEWGPIPMAEVTRLLRGASLSAVVLDERALPLHVTKARQQASAGLRRALLARDGGCRYPGCDTPASWCDVAHAAEAARHGGRLSPGNAVLLCRRHHRKVDRPGWTIRIDGPDITFRPPSGAAIRAGPPHRTALAAAAPEDLAQARDPTPQREQLALAPPAARGRGP
jgi:hypothetical protein